MLDRVESGLDTERHSSCCDFVYAGHGFSLADRIG